MISETIRQKLEEFKKITILIIAVFLMEKYTTVSAVFPQRQF